jgi:glycosyltransferase involved in cell wall biosynthesis
MLSVIIPTRDSEQTLVPTLAALVPGATGGIITEVLVADGGSQDETAAVADVAGCNFIAVEGPLGLRLKTAAAKARAPWLLFLRPGIVLDTPWTGEVGRFVQQPARYGEAAVFRRGGPAQSTVREFLLLVSAVLGGLPHPEQGLLISSHFYSALGGHFERASDPERDFLRRIGRARCVRFTTNAFVPARE